MPCFLIDSCVIGCTCLATPPRSNLLTKRWNRTGPRPRGGNALWMLRPRSVTGQFIAARQWFLVRTARPFADGRRVGVHHIEVPLRFAPYLRTLILLTHRPQQNRNPKIVVLPALIALMRAAIPPTLHTCSCVRMRWTPPLRPFCGQSVWSSVVTATVRPWAAAGASKACNRNDPVPARRSPVRRNPIHAVEGCRGRALAGPVSQREAEPAI